MHKHINTHACTYVLTYTQTHLVHTLMDTFRHSGCHIYVFVHKSKGIQTYTRAIFMYTSAAHTWATKWFQISILLCLYIAHNMLWDSKTKYTMQSLVKGQCWGGVGGHTASVRVGLFASVGVSAHPRVCICPYVCAVWVERGRQSRAECCSAVGQRF